MDLNTSETETEIPAPVINFLDRFRKRYQAADERDFTELFSLREILEMCSMDTVNEETDPAMIEQGLSQFGFRTMTNGSGTWYMVSNHP